LTQVSVKFRPSSHSNDCTIAYVRNDLKIEVVCPRGVTPDNFPLILSSEQTTLLFELIPLCDQPEITRSGEEEVWLFQYSGDQIHHFPSWNGSKPSICIKRKEYFLNERLRVVYSRSTEKNSRGEDENVYVHTP
jgi:hypothetical protein